MVSFFMSHFYPLTLAYKKKWSLHVNLLQMVTQSTSGWNCTVKSLFFLIQTGVFTDVFCAVKNKMWKHLIFWHATENPLILRQGNQCCKMLTYFRVLGLISGMISHPSSQPLVSGTFYQTDWQVFKTCLISINQCETMSPVFFLTSYH